MSNHGRQPQVGLEPRVCEICGSSYQPYRASARACSKQCYRKLPHVRRRDAEYKAAPPNRARRNEIRRVDANPARREVNLRWGLHKYGLTIEQYRERLVAQDGKCAICDKPPTEGGIRSAARLHVDHDHITGANRGLLCNRCNPGIGYFNNNPALLRAAIDYLRRYE